MDNTGKKKNLLWTIITNFDAIITAVTLSLCTIVVNCNVLMRYFVKSPLFWAEEVATGLFVWTVFLGSAYAFRKKAHLGVDILVDLVPAGPRKYVKLFVQFLTFGVLVMLTSISATYVLNTWSKLTDTLRIPSWYVSVAVPIGFGLSLIYCVIQIVEEIKALFVKGGNK